MWAMSMGNTTTSISPQWDRPFGQAIGFVTKHVNHTSSAKECDIEFSKANYPLHTLSFLIFRNINLQGDTK
jgi:hypothetical protein